MHYHGDVAHIHEYDDPEHEHEMATLYERIHGLSFIEGAQTWVENLATRPDLDRIAQISKMLNEARARLHRRMHEHGVHH